MIELNRQPVTTPEDLARAAADLGARDMAVLLVKRGNNTFYTSLQILA